jgi:chemotaxis protein methyltransferase CheR
LSEAGLYERCQIYATDLSPRALEQAKLGMYSAALLPSFTTNYQRAGGTSDFASYWTVAYDGIAIREVLRRNILFFQHDLVGDHIFGEMDVILCRNVLIYFGRDLQNRVVRKLAGGLHPGGFLCLGCSERLSGPAMQMFTPFAENDRIYKQVLAS